MSKESVGRPFIQEEVRKGEGKFTAEIAGKSNLTVSEEVLGRDPIERRRLNVDVLVFKQEKKVLQ
jgi:hypothetical protein